MLFVVCIYKTTWWCVQKWYYLPFHLGRNGQQKFSFFFWKNRFIGITQIYRWLHFLTTFRFYYVINGTKMFFFFQYRNEEENFVGVYIKWDDAWCSDDIILSMLFLMLFYILLYDYFRCVVTFLLCVFVVVFSFSSYNFFFQHFRYTKLWWCDDREWWMHLML